MSEAWLPRGTALAGFGVTALALFLGFRIFYVVPGRSFGEGVDRFLARVPVPLPVLLALAGAYVITGLILGWVLVRRGSPPSLDGGPSSELDTPPGPPSARPGAPSGRKKEFQVTHTP